MVLQGYIAWTNALQGFVDRTALDDRTKERARFAVSLLTDALAPTNTLLGNPVALKKTWDTRGQNLVDGLKNLIDDVKIMAACRPRSTRRHSPLARIWRCPPGMVVFSQSRA